MKNLINWVELSKLLTGGKWNLRRDKKIPEKYREKVNSLFDILEKWKADYLE